MSDTSGDQIRHHENPVIDEESPAPEQQPGGKEIVADREKSPEQTELSEEELEAERQRRLDPENRPEFTEVDNTGRTFDPISGTFEDDDRDGVNAPFADPSESV
ncbi:hypothetical protein [Nocardioides caldifontis]|uniref:hypothetical protein n=1 Tax=Nocardioides caldifontis TaxID=2588938 RepID=UPI0011DFC439|nr:hypothetical protein [Nocardioides caldifontis]